MPKAFALLLAIVAVVCIVLPSKVEAGLIGGSGVPDIVVCNQGGGTFWYAHLDGRNTTQWYYAAGFAELYFTVSTGVLADDANGTCTNMGEGTTTLASLITNNYGLSFSGSSSSLSVGNGTATTTNVATLLFSGFSLSSSSPNTVKILDVPSSSSSTAATTWDAQVWQWIFLMVLAAWGVYFGSWMVRGK